MRALPLVRIPIGRRSGRSSLRHYSARQAHDEGLIARGPAGADANRYLSVAASLVNLVLTFGGGNTVRRNRAAWQHGEETLCSIAGFYDQSRRLCQPCRAPFQRLDSS